MVESNLPKIPIEERMRMVMENVDKYSTDELFIMWTEWKAYIEKLKVEKKDAKAKAKMLKKFEKAVDEEYAATWRTALRVFGSKIKGIKIKKHKE